MSNDKAPSRETAGNRARVLCAREPRHLFIFFAARVVWLVKAAVRWNERYTLRQHLQNMPDHTLKDVGISRDQISAVISGSLKRGPSKLETSAAAVSINGDYSGVLTVALNAVRLAAFAVFRWYKRRNAIRELMALDNRTLKDINVRRDDIYWVTGQIFSPGEDHFHISPASPPPGSVIPEAWTVARRKTMAVFPPRRVRRHRQNEAQ